MPSARLVVKLALRLAFGRNPAGRWRRTTLPLAAGVTTFVFLFLVGFHSAAGRVDDRLAARSFVVATEPGDSQLRLLVSYDTWDGEQFEVRYVEPLSGDAPLPPGLAGWPRPGGYAVSAGLKRAIDAHPELQVRYGDPALLGPSGTTDGSEWIAYGTPPEGTTIDRSRATLLEGWGARHAESGDPRTDLGELALPAIVFLGLPAAFVTWGAARTATPVRDARAQVLHWMGVPRRFTATLAAAECALLVTPGVALGGLVWAAFDQSIVRLPLTGYRPVHGDLVVSSTVQVVAVGALVLAAASTHTYLRARRSLTLGTGTRPWVEPRLSWWGVLPAVAGAVAVAWQALDPAPARSPLLIVATPVLLAVGAAFAAPFLARFAGAAIATARRSVVALLAGRAVERDPAGFARPVIGLGLFGFIALIGVHLVFVESRYEEPASRRDPFLEAAVVVLDGGSSTAAAGVVAAALPGDVVAPYDRATSALAARCDDLSRVLGSPACRTDGQLDESARDRLQIMLGSPSVAPVRLVDELAHVAAGPAAMAPALVVVGERRADFASDVANAVMPSFLTVQVRTLEDLTLRPSGVWGWIEAGLAACGILTVLGLFITAVDRSLHDPSSSTLRALGPRSPFCGASTSPGSSLPTRWSSARCWPSVWRTAG